MAESFQSRQLQHANNQSLQNFLRVLEDWGLPFLSGWMNGGPQPRPGPSEVERVHNLVAEYKEQKALPEEYAWLPTLLEKLSESLRFNKRNFVNVHPNPLIPPLLASLLVSVQNPNNIVADVSGPTTALETGKDGCIEWLAKLVGFDPSQAWGNVVSGGTIANLTALLVARDYTYNKLARPRNHLVREKGVFNRLPGVVATTAGAHYSIKKSMWILGLGDENVKVIPVAVDEIVRQRWPKEEKFLGGITDCEWERRIHDAVSKDEERIAELENFYLGRQEPFTLQPLESEIFKTLYTSFEYGTPLLGFVFTPGTIDTGTIENLSEKATELLVEEDVYIHADAAVSGFMLQHPRVMAKVGDLSFAQSVTLDGHKYGHLAYPNGAVVFRERGLVYEIMHEAPYLEGLAPTIEGSRPGSHVAALWAATRDVDRSRLYSGWLEKIFAFVDALVEGLAATDSYQILAQVDLTTVVIAPHVANGETRREVNKIVRRIYDTIRHDTSEKAFLVNMDRHLSDIKVRNDNKFSSDVNPSTDLVDVFSLRIVCTNPAVEPEDAHLLIEYLELMLRKARSNK